MLYKDIFKLCSPPDTGKGNLSGIFFGFVLLFVNIEHEMSKEPVANGLFTPRLLDRTLQGSFRRRVWPLCHCLSEECPGALLGKTRTL